MQQNSHEHLQSYRKLAAVFGALIVLTAITISVSRLDLGPFKIATALSVACVKASLVLLIFMQMKEAGRAVAITFLITLTVLALFIGFIFFDVAYR